MYIKCSMQTYVSWFSSYCKTSLRFFLGESINRHSSCFLFNRSTSSEMFLQNTRSPFLKKFIYTQFY